MLRSKTLKLFQIGIVATTLLSTVLSYDFINDDFPNSLSPQILSHLGSNENIPILSLQTAQDTDASATDGTTTTTTSTDGSTATTTETTPTNTTPEEKPAEEKPAEPVQPAKKLKKMYNILSLDGGGIRGIIPAMVIKHMESESYSYAFSKGYDVSEFSDKQKIPMKNLFNMIAGTSTGGLLTTALVAPTKQGG